jgi:hypothetical protein
MSTEMQPSYRYISTLQSANCGITLTDNNKVVQALHCDDDHCKTEESSSLDVEQCDMKTAFTET